jgi:hypothetical protein
MYELSGIKKILKLSATNFAVAFITAIPTFIAPQQQNIARTMRPERAQRT